jgi:flagellar assembly protein FliH
MTDPTRFSARVRPFQWAELEEEPPVRTTRAPEPRIGASSGAHPETLLEEARRAADALLAAAHAEVESLREEARRRGYEAGSEDGRRLAEEAATRWGKMVEELAAYRPRLYEDARGEVVELVLALVGKILGPIAEGDRETVVRVTGQALQALSDRETLTIRVNPEDLQALLDAKPRLLQSFDGVKKLTVMEDPSVGRGGCLVETATAEIDARLESQLQEIARTLRKA